MTSNARYKDLEKELDLLYQELTKSTSNLGLEAFAYLQTAITQVWKHYSNLEKSHVVKETLALRQSLKSCTPDQITHEFIKVLRGQISHVVNSDEAFVFFDGLEEATRLRSEAGHRPPWTPISPRESHNVRISHDNLQEVVNRINKRVEIVDAGENRHRWEALVAYLARAVEKEHSRLDADEIAFLFDELYQIVEWLDRCLEHRYQGTYEAIVRRFKEEQKHCRATKDSKDEVGSIMGYILNKEEDEGHLPPWASSNSPAHHSSSAHSLEHRLSSRQKKIYIRA